MKTTIFTFTFLLVTMTIQAQDFAIKQLESSPRHQEWVTILSNDRPLYAFVVYPERATKSKVVIVIHENRGLNDWARSFADQLAEKGYIAVAPDLLSGANSKYEKTTDYPTSDEAREYIYKLDADNITNDLNAVFEYAKKIESSNGEVSVIGFCWGGSQSFRYATNNPNIKEALVFYGTAPEDENLYSNIKTKVYGFYGEDDQRVNSTLPKTEELMKKNKKVYKYQIYKGAGHAYMRSGDDPNGSEANKKARNDSWERLTQILK